MKVLIFLFTDPWIFEPSVRTEGPNAWSFVCFIGDPHLLEAMRTSQSKLSGHSPPCGKGTKVDKLTLLQTGVFPLWSIAVAEDAKDEWLKSVKMDGGREERVLFVQLFL